MSTDEPELKRFLQANGARVRRAEAMTLLCISDTATFRKVVDAHPALCHRLPGEGQSKYLTTEIFKLLGARRTQCQPDRQEGGK